MNEIYIEELSENLYSFNLKEFLTTQDIIYNKFKLDGDGIDLIDKYILQILEEIHEVNNSTSPQEQAEELIDVAMYLGSTFSTLFPVLPIDEITLKVVSTNNDRIDVKRTMDKLFSSLMSSRRMFPERKWHKKESNDIKASNEDINVVLIMLYNMIKEIFEYLIFSNKIINPFIYIEAKEKKILSNK